MDLGGAVVMHQPVHCELGSDGRIHACMSACGLGDFDGRIENELEQRMYQPVVRNGRPVTVPYSFLAEVHAPRGVPCAPREGPARVPRAGADAGPGPLVPTCKDLARDACPIEKLEVLDADLPYPPEVLRRGVEGNADVECTLDVTGAIRNCTSAPLKSLFSPSVSVGDAVARFVEARRYVPPTVAGKPTSTPYGFEVHVHTSANSELARRSARLEISIIQQARGLLATEPRFEQLRSDQICVADRARVLRVGDVRKADRNATLSATGDIDGCTGMLELSIGRPMRAEDGSTFVTATLGRRELESMSLSFAANADLTATTLAGRGLIGGF